MKIDLKQNFESNNKKVAELIESIKSRIDDFQSEKINWGHVGTLDHIIYQLNDIDNSLARYNVEPTIDEKSFDKKTNRFQIKK